MGETENITEMDSLLEYKPFSEQTANTWKMNDFSHKLPQKEYEEV